MFDTTLAAFKSFVGVWLDVSDLTSDMKSTAITLAEKRIQRGDGSPSEPGLRVREMETAFTGTISGTGTLSLPSNFLDLKIAYVNSSPVQFLERKSAEYIYKTYPDRTASGQPKFIAREGDHFIFGPFPDSSYVVKGTIYRTLPSLVSDGTINTVFTAYSDIYLKGTVLECEKLLGRDKRTQTWEPDFRKQIQAANRQAEQEEYSGSSLSVTYGGGCP